MFVIKGEFGSVGEYERAVFVLVNWLKEILIIVALIKFLFF